MPMLRFDYDSVLDRLKKRTLKKLDGQNLILFSTNSALLEVVAEEFDDLSLYDEFLTRENIWDTARGSSSIMKQVGFFDYCPHRKIGATGTVQFSTSKDFNGSWPYSINIPTWSQSSGGGVIFLTKESYYLPAGSNFVEIPVIQGELAKYTHSIEPASYPSPKGTSYAQIPIYDLDIENTLYEVKVNGGEPWKEIGNIRLAVQEKVPEKAQVYAIRTMPRYEGVVLYFGNDMLGKSLQYGDTVEFTYIRTKGSEGNILSAGIINTVNSEIKDEKNNVVNLFCRNTAALVGGQDYESLVDIKVNAPRSFQTGNRAISSIDYDTLIRKIGIVDEIQVWGEKEINEDNGNPPGTYVEASENLIYITGYTIDSLTSLGVPITESGKQEIRDFLNDKKGTTDILQFVDTQIIFVTFKPVVFVKDTRYTLEQVKEFVHNNLKSNYSIGQLAYKTGLYLSDYLAVIDNTVGVDHCTCTLSFSEIVLFKSAYEFTVDINIKDIKPNTVYIKIKNDQAGMKWQNMAKDDGEGNLIGCLINPADPSKGSYQLPGATINYQDGSIGHIIVSGLSEDFTTYEIRIDFELEDATGGDLNLMARNQVVAWYDEDFTMQRMD